MTVEAGQLIGIEAGGGAALASISVIGVFIAILAVGLLYDVKKGGLDWD